jgi:hypothetical protein
MFICLIEFLMTFDCITINTEENRSITFTIPQKALKKCSIIPADSIVAIKTARPVDLVHRYHHLIKKYFVL